MEAGGNQRMLMLMSNMQRLFLASPFSFSVSALHTFSADPSVPSRARSDSLMGTKKLQIEPLLHLKKPTNACTCFLIDPQILANSELCLFQKSHDVSQGSATITRQLKLTYLLLIGPEGVCITGLRRVGVGLRWLLFYCCNH